MKAKYSYEKDKAIARTKLGSGLRFLSASSQRLDSLANTTLDNFAFDNTKNYTFSLNVKIDGPGPVPDGCNFMASNTSGTSGQFGLIMAYTNTRQLRFFVAAAGSLVVSTITAGGVFEYGDLLNVSGTVENTATLSIVSLYLNKQLIGTASASKGPSSTVFGKMQLGGGTVASRYTNTTIYSAKFFTNYLANQAEIAVLYNNLETAGLTAAKTLDLDFGQNRGNKFYDTSGNDNTFVGQNFGTSINYLGGAYRDRLGNLAK